jgi:hypothetical protein
VEFRLKEELSYFVELHTALRTNPERLPQAFAQHSGSAGVMSPHALSALILQLLPARSQSELGYVLALVDTHRNKHHSMDDALGLINGCKLAEGAVLFGGSKCSPLVGELLRKTSQFLRAHRDTLQSKANELMADAKRNLLGLAAWRSVLTALMPFATVLEMNILLVTLHAFDVHDKAALALEEVKQALAVSRPRRRAKGLYADKGDLSFRVNLSPKLQADMDQSESKGRKKAWPDGWIDKRTEEWIDQRTDQRMDQRPDQRTDQRTDQRPDQRTDQRTDKQTDGQIDRQTDGQTGMADSTSAWQATRRGEEEETDWTPELDLGFMSPGGGGGERSGGGGGESADLVR